MNARTFDAYRQARDTLLATFVTHLQRDERISAAWLAANIGRGAHDPLRDLDITPVITAAAAVTLCRRASPAQAGTTPERLALFTRYGQLANIHENHHNAPPTGTFTATLYAPSGLAVDWTLVPQSQATRPPATHLLFDHAGIPPAPAAQPPAHRRADRRAHHVLLVSRVLNRHGAPAPRHREVPGAPGTIHTHAPGDRVAAGRTRTTIPPRLRHHAADHRHPTPRHARPRRRARCRSRLIRPTHAPQRTRPAHRTPRHVGSAGS